MFISIEGLDGSGSTTLVETISDEYTDAVQTAEPSEFEYGQIVRDRLAQEDSDALIDFYLFMADRMDHINRKVRPADESGKLVISDRYADSTRVYQPVALTNSGHFESQSQAKDFIEHTMAPWNYEPDITFYIDISVDTAMRRAEGSEKYEKREFLEKVRDNYEALVQHNDRIVRIDGEQSKKEVAAKALARLDVVAPDRV